MIELTSGQVRILLEALKEKYGPDSREPEIGLLQSELSCLWFDLIDKESPLTV